MGFANGAPCRALPQVAIKIFDKTQERSEYVGSGFNPGLLNFLAVPANIPQSQGNQG